MRIIIVFRPFSWFFKKNWYAERPPQDMMGERYFLLDIGAVTIGYAISGIYY